MRSTQRRPTVHDARAVSSLADPGGINQRKFCERYPSIEINSRFDEGNAYPVTVFPQETAQGSTDLKIKCGLARRRAPASQRWKTFLRNHADGIAAMDLFVVPTISFRRLYGLLIMAMAGGRSCGLR